MFFLSLIFLMMIKRSITKNSSIQVKVKAVNILYNREISICNIIMIMILFLVVCAGFSLYGGAKLFSSLLL
jgi:hypothetical protein